MFEPVNFASAVTFEDLVNLERVIESAVVLDMLRADGKMPSFETLGRLKDEMLSSKYNSSQCTHLRRSSTDTVCFVCGTHYA